MKNYFFVLALLFLGFGCTSSSQSSIPSNSVSEAELKTFSSELVNFSFSYPSTSDFQEKDIFADREAFPDVESTGKNILFQDQNNQAPEFNAITKDLTVTGLTVPYDILDGDLNSEDSFKITTFYNDLYTKTIPMGVGIYWVTGFTNMECSPFVNSYLIVNPPEGSGLKYILFYLGDAGAFAEDELEDICLPKDSAIIAKINSVMNREISFINERLDLAIQIAETFSLGQN